MKSDRKALISIAGDPLAGPHTDQAEYLQSGWGDLGRELSILLQEKNGFYAFESSLLVRPFSRREPPLGLVQWNENGSWKKEYRSDLSSVLFFAEDVFGVQFAMMEGEVYEFDPETADFKKLADSLDSWCFNVYRNYRVRTGFPLAHAWQLANGPLEMGFRLLPKVPFVLGGEFSLANLHALPDVKGMLFRASLANQLKDVPNGSRVIIRNKFDHP